MTSDQAIVVSCPTCKKPVPWTSKQTFKPFCSQRCKLIDLGDWATEAHKIPGEEVVTTEFDDGQFDSAD